MTPPASLHLQGRGEGGGHQLAPTGRRLSATIRERRPAGRVTARPARRRAGARLAAEASGRNDDGRRLVRRRGGGLPGSPFGAASWISEPAGLARGQDGIIRLSQERATMEDARRNERRHARAGDQLAVIADLLVA